MVSIANLANLTGPVENGYACNDTEEWARDTFGHPLMASTSFASLFPNAFVVVVLRRLMSERRTWGRTHLSFLAYSDIFCSFSYVWGAVWSRLCVPNRQCEAGRRCFHGYVAFRVFLTLSAAITRSITLYVTYFRAKAVSGVRNAMTIDGMSSRRVLVELIVYTVLIGILSIMVWYVLRFLFKSSNLSLAIVLTFVSIAMAAMAVFILFRIRLNRQRSQSGLPAADDLQTQVAIVALVFCGCNLVSTAASVLLHFAEDEREKYWPHIASYFFILLNSTVNLFIYLTNSDFRDASSRSLLCLIRRTEQ